MSSLPALRSPLTAVDVIIETSPDKIVLIKRKNPPLGWALPGGFVDYGESLWQGALREAREETSLTVDLLEQLYTYSDPTRDHRCHTITTVFVGTSDGKPAATSDAEEVQEFDLDKLPPLAFDHQDIVNDYVNWRKTGSRPHAVRRCKPSADA